MLKVQCPFCGGDGYTVTNSNASLETKDGTKPLYGVRFTHRGNCVLNTGNYRADFHSEKEAVDAHTPVNYTNELRNRIVELQMELDSLKQKLKTVKDISSDSSHAYAVISLNKEGVVEGWIIRNTPDELIDALNVRGYSEFVDNIKMQIRDGNIDLLKQGRYLLYDNHWLLVDKDITDRVRNASSSNINVSEFSFSRPDTKADFEGAAPVDYIVPPPTPINLIRECGDKPIAPPRIPKPLIKAPALKPTKPHGSLLGRISKLVEFAQRMRALQRFGYIVLDVETNKVLDAAINESAYYQQTVDPS